MDRKQVELGFIVEQEHLAGRCYVLTGPWEPRCVQVMRKEGAQFLRLNPTLGARFDVDLQFLRGLTFLRGVEIYAPSVKDLAELVSLPQLELLGLQCPFKRIDFAAAFPQLRFASFAWRPGCETFFESEGLQFLFMEGYPQEDLTTLQRLSQLRRMHVNARKLKSARGVEMLASLDHVTFAYCRALADITALADCEPLRVLEFHNCPLVSDLAPIGSLRNLKRLTIENGVRVESVAPLLGCVSLEELYLPGTKVEDGDLSHLLKLPHLKRIALPKSTAHSHSADEINRALAARTP
jgi:hypothetical protein